MGAFAAAMLITLCLLGLLVAALMYVRRRGWIAWPQASRPAAAAEEGIQLQASRRLSLGTTVHVVSYRGQAYLVTECSRGTNATVMPVVPAPTLDEGKS